VLYEFPKVLVSLQRLSIESAVDDLIVVEGFPWFGGCIKTACEVVATMGADCSERQAELVVSLVIFGPRRSCPTAMMPENGLRKSFSCGKFRRIASRDG